MHKVVEICKDNPELTAKDIADMAGVSRARVYQVLSAHGMRAAPANFTAIHEVNKDPHKKKLMRSGRRMTSSFRGDMSEILIAHDLMSRGFYVYRSMTGNAPFDLLAYSDGENGALMLRVEVKSGSINENGVAYNQPANREFDVIAVVDILSRKIVYKPDLPE